MSKPLLAAIITLFALAGLAALGCGDDSGAGGGCQKATDCPQVDCSGIPTSVCVGGECDTNPETACVPAS